jgi:predicted site-specific integrase-resolvase
MDNKYKITVMKPAELCEELGICRRTLARYEDQGLIRPIKFNARVFRYDLADVEVMLLKLKGEAA